MNASRNCRMIQLLVACLVPQSAGVLATTAVCVTRLYGSVRLAISDGRSYRDS